MRPLPIYPEAMPRPKGPLASRKTYLSTRDKTIDRFIKGGDEYADLISQVVVARKRAAA